MLRTQVLSLDEVVAAVQDSSGSDVESVAALSHMLHSGRLLFRRSSDPRVMPAPRTWRQSPPIEIHIAERTRSH
jgi:hypothetical protein